MIKRSFIIKFISLCLCVILCACLTACGEHKYIAQEELIEDLQSDTTDEVADESGDTAQDKASMDVMCDFDNFDINPTIVLKFENVKPAEVLMPEYFGLSGAFEHLSITAIKSVGDSVILSTVGKISANGAMMGGVLASELTNNSNTRLFNTVNGDYIGAYVDNSSMKFSNGKFSFDLKLGDDIFIGQLPAISVGVTMQDIELNAESLSEDCKILSLSINANSFDDAISLLNGKTITIAPSVLRSGYAVNACFYNAPARLSVAATELSEKSQNKYTLSGYMYADNGEFENLDKSDITFSGDLENADIDGMKLENVEDYYIFEVDFSSNKNLYSGKVLRVDGNIEISSGLLKNEWGTDSSNLQSRVTYSTVTSGRNIFSDGWAALKNFFNEHKTAFKAVSTAASTVGTFLGLGNGIYSLLQSTGAVSSITGQKLDTIISVLDGIQSDIEIMKNDLTNISNKLDEQYLAIQEGFDEVALRDYGVLWDNYGDKIKALNETMESFNNLYTACVKTFIYEPSDINVYLIDGEATMIHPLYNSKIKEDINGDRIDSVVTVEFKEDMFNPIIEKIDAYGGMYSTVFDDMERIIENYNLVAYEAGNPDKEVNVDIDNIIHALQYIFTADVLEKNNMANTILTQYKDACSELTGNSLDFIPSPTTDTVLEAYYAMLESYFNFEAEAAGVMQSSLSFINYSIVNAGYIAVIARQYIDSDYTSVEASEFSKYYDSANEAISYYYEKFEEYESITDVRISESDNPGEAYALGVELKGYQYYNYPTLLMPYLIPDELLSYYLSNAWTTAELEKKLNEHFNNTTYLNEFCFASVINRWNRLKLSGVTKTDTFVEYLENFNILTTSSGDLSGKDILFLIDTPREHPLKNTSLTCYSHTGNIQSYTSGINYPLTVGNGISGKYMEGNVYQLLTNGVTKINNKMLAGVGNYYYSGGSGLNFKYEMASFTYYHNNVVFGLTLA